MNILLLNPQLRKAEKRCDATYQQFRQVKKHAEQKNK
jgi:hypothetical protein